MVTTYGRDAELLPGQWVSWPASPPEPTPITMLSCGILGGDAIDRSWRRRTTVAALISIFSARQRAERAICYRKSVCLSVCLSVTRVDQSKTVEVRIMHFHRTVAPPL